jgi:hypothetical protein
LRATNRSHCSLILRLHHRTVKIYFALSFRRWTPPPMCPHGNCTTSPTWADEKMGLSLMNADELLPSCFTPDDWVTCVAGVHPSAINGPLLPVGEKDKI